MKPVRSWRKANRDGVAPRAGAWIETFSAHPGVLWVMSPPARGRGLKPVIQDDLWQIYHVAPRAGAWIETSP